MRSSSTVNGQHTWPTCQEVNSSKEQNVRKLGYFSVRWHWRVCLEKYIGPQAQKRASVLPKCLILFNSHLQLSPGAHWIESCAIYWNRIQKWLKHSLSWNQAAFQLWEHLDTSTCRNKAAFQILFARPCTSLLTCIIYSVKKGTFYLTPPDTQIKLSRFYED